MIYLTKDVKDIHIENCKKLTKETENNTKKIENDMKISLAIELEELISLKIAILPKAIMVHGFHPWLWNLHPACCTMCSFPHPLQIAGVTQYVLKLEFFPKYAELLIIHLEEGNGTPRQ